MDKVCAKVNHPQVGWVGLHDAAKEDNLEMMINIVEGKRGLPIRGIDMPTETGLTPLHVAALSGSNLCIAYLLGQGCDVNLIDDHGRLGLHWAADGGHVESMMHLIAAGQDIDQLDHNGMAPLHLAARRGMTQACVYLVEVGASLSLKNARNWTPCETATVPIYRATQESVEQSMGMVNRIRREHDEIELMYFLTECGMERFIVLFEKSQYTYHRLFWSARPISMKMLNSQTEDKNEQMNIRDYMLFIEYLQMKQGVKKFNPFQEAAKQQKYWDKHPEEWEKFLEENPDYDAAEQDDSEYRRPVLEKENEFMSFMRDTVLMELKKADKKQIFFDMRATKEVAYVGFDGRVRCDDEALEFDGIQGVKAVDAGFRDCEVLDFKQMEKNINDGMYQCWEHFCLDFLVMIANAWIYCRAVKSDIAESYQQAVSIGARGVRIFRKHRTSLRKYQAATMEERRTVAEDQKVKWNKWVTDKRVRGMVPDFFKELASEAEALGETEFLSKYTQRFATLQEAQEHWNEHKVSNLFEVARVGWEEDHRSCRYHKQLRWMLDLTASRDFERHFQHPAEDVRSDLHLPGGDLQGKFTVEQFLREITWPMDFDTMREQLAAEWEPDYYTKRANDYVALEQIQMDWLITQMNVISFHHRNHEAVKKLLRVEQRPRTIIPKAPCGLQVAANYLDAWCAKVLWNQPKPKPGEQVLKYRLTLTTDLEQPVEPHRTGCRPGEVREIFVNSDNDSYSDIKLKNLHSLVSTGASWQGGCCLIDGLSPKTNYNVIIQAGIEGDVFGPTSQPLLRFSTLAAVPKAPTGLHVLDVNDNASIIQWDAPADNGSNILDYELEYQDIKFHRRFTDRVHWHDTSFSTRRTQDSTVGKDPLVPFPHVPGLPGLMVPATCIEVRVCARNEAGCSEWSPFILYETKSAPASAPQGLALLGTGCNYLDIAWMSPVASNSTHGIVAFELRVEIQHSRTGELETRFEDLTVEALRQERVYRGYCARPTTSSRRSTPPPLGSRPASRKTSRDESRPCSVAGRRSRSGVGPNVLLLFGEEEDVNDKPVVLDELKLTRSGENRMPTPEEWWVASEFSGKIWFHDEVPRQVIEKASLDYSPIGTDNNLIIIQELGTMGWGHEKYALLPPTFADANTLAVRTTSAFQATIPVEIPLKWAVLVDTTNRFSFQLNCQFRLKMPASLAYVFGLVAALDGWITSPALKSSGLTNDKSVLTGKEDYRVLAFVCDQMPVRTPFMHRVENLPPGCRVRINVRANNAAGAEYCDPTSLGRESPNYIEGYTESILPPPPTNLRTQAVLSTAVIIFWNLPVNNTGDPIENLEISFEKGFGRRLHYVIDAKQEGYQVGGLTPGEVIRDISIRSINKNGVGPPCAEPIAFASSLASIPTACHDFRVIETTRTSITFAWVEPAYNGGAPIIEWEVAGFSPSGGPIVHRISTEHLSSYTIECEPHDHMGVWCLEFGVRCRNTMGWGPKSEVANGRTTDGAHPDPDLMNVRMREQKRMQDGAVSMLRKAIAMGTAAEVDAERAVRQPIRFKKALMEEAENSVAAAETALLAAIDESERTGIKKIGVSQPKEDIEARMLLERLQLKRKRRWGDKRRGLAV
jgi:Mg2+ and Co2+ transporter CorA